MATRRRTHPADGSASTRLPRFDVAFSFLDPDRGLALKLGKALRPHLTYFVYSEHQRELAGRDGAETFTHLFTEQSRLNVVLLREGWGGTRFTRIEEAAIKTRATGTGWSTLLVIRTDTVSRPPIWIPPERIYMDYGVYGLRETVGVIKARAQEAGAEIHTETASEELIRHAREKRERAARLARLEREGLQESVAEAQTLFRAIAAIVSELNAAEPTIDVRCGYDLEQCAIVGPWGSTGIAWAPEYSNAIGNTKLQVVGYRGAPLAIPGSDVRYIREPEEISRLQFTFGLSEEEEWVWIGQRDSWSSSAMADQIMRWHRQRAFEPAPPPRPRRMRNTPPWVTDF